jgi:hypothetical protein
MNQLLPCLEGVLLLDLGILEDGVDREHSSTAHHGAQDDLLEQTCVKHKTANF